MERLSMIIIFFKSVVLFELEMSSMFWILISQMVSLFWKDVEPVGNGIYLADMGHCK